MYIIGLNGWVVWDYLGEDFIRMITRLTLSWLLVFLFYAGLLVRIVGLILEYILRYTEENET
jgi:hypothetical protein